MKLNSYAQLMVLCSGILFVAGITFYDEDAEYRPEEREKRKNPRAYRAAMKKAVTCFCAISLLSGIVSSCGSSHAYEVASFVILLIGILVFFLTVFLISRKYR